MSHAGGIMALLALSVPRPRSLPSQQRQCNASPRFLVACVAAIYLIACAGCNADGDKTAGASSTPLGMS